MNIFGKPLNQVNEDDLKKLKGNPQFRESQSLDFKEFLEDLNQREKKKEFIKDITAMANSFGGLLIVGVQENKDNGLPNAIDGQDMSTIGIQHKNVGNLKDSLQEIIVTKTEPRLGDVRIYPVLLANGNYVMIFDIPKSSRLPHQNKLNDRFYKRYDTVCLEMSEEERLALEANSEYFHDKLERFRNGRINKLISRITPVELNHAPITALHIIPASAISSNESFQLNQLFLPLPDGNIQLNNPNIQGLGLYNLNAGIIREYGLLTFNEYYEMVQAEYALILFSGIIEAVESVYFSSKSPYQNNRQIAIRSKYFSNIVDKTGVLLKLLSEIGTVGPYWIALSLIDVKGISIIYPKIPGHPIGSDHLIPLAVPVDRFDSNVGNALEPVFDKIWQAAGYAKSYLNENYEW